MANEDAFQKIKTDLIAQNESTYGKEVRQRFGDKAMDDSNRKLAGLTEEQWQHLTRYTYIKHGDHWVKHYDLGLAIPFKAMDEASAKAGEQYLWTAYASIQAPILITRGQDSDLLSTDTLDHMLESNKRARAIQFAGVGHAPTIMAADQIAAVEGFLNEN